MQRANVNLFVENWDDIIGGSIEPNPQESLDASYHSKREIENLDRIDLENIMKVGDLINLLRARSFGDKSFAYFLLNGKRNYLNLRFQNQIRLSSKYAFYKN